MDVFEGLIDDKLLKILKKFLENPSELFHLKKISDGTDVSLASTFRIINKLKDMGLIETRSISKFKVYSLANNSKTKRLRKML